MLIQDATTGKASLPKGDNQVMLVKQTGTVQTTPEQGTTSSYNSTGTTNATSVKSTSGVVYSLIGSNVNAATRYVKLYNKATAPTVGVDTPALVIPIATSGVISVNFGPIGATFSNGIAFAITAGAADADSTIVAVGDVKAVISYK